MNDYLCQIIKDKGYKLTHQRQAILSFLLENPNRHMSCEEIYERMKDTDPDLGQATVYRTLQLFTDLGITTRHDFDDGKSRFEISSAGHGHNHHHLICMGCGKIEEVNLDLMEKLEDLVAKKYNFEIVDHNVKIYGYCSQCRGIHKNR